MTADDDLDEDEYMRALMRDMRAQKAAALNAVDTTADRPTHQSAENCAPQSDPRPSEPMSHDGYLSIQA